MIRNLTLVALLAVSLFAAAPPQPAYDALRAEAERYFEEKSFSRAHELYEQAAKLELTPAERRWVRFRLADTQWRGGDRDASVQRTLEDLIREADAAHDRVWAEANESLGDLYGGGQYWLNALDWWAGSDDLELARRRYLSLVFRMAPNDYPYNVPRNVLVNAVEIAKTPDDRAHTRYLLASQLVNDGRADAVAHALDLLEEIIALGPTTKWYDDALHLAAQHFERRGDPRVSSSFTTPGGADIEKALAYYMKLAALPDSRYRDEAKHAIERITAATLSVSVAGNFLPDSEQELLLGWRNVKNVALSIYAVDLTKDLHPDPRHNPYESITLGTPVRTWTYTTSDDGKHVPGMERIRLDPKLERGAYVITASSGTAKTRVLVLVTDLNIVLHSQADTMMLYVSDVLTGEPAANARVHVWLQMRDAYVDQELRTDSSGLARAKFKEGSGGVYITASAGARQAYLQSYSYLSSDTVNPEWRIYAFTDRPAYRPGETVQWKIIARVRDGNGYTTPSGQTLNYEIRNERGEKVANGTAMLSAFGSYSGKLPLDASMLLGSYSIVLSSGKEEEGAAQLFRLEEYKLPEFLVSVTTPKERQYRLGDTIEATVEASYYFGGPVANADVEVVVTATPFVRWWYPWRRYPWFYGQDDDMYDRQYGGSEIKRETLKTGADGRAVVRIDTPFEGTDTDYRIEARVVDASRREVSGQGHVRVTRSRYSVILTPEHFVHRPGDSVSVDVKALDANDQPVQTSGTITVTRGEDKELTTKVATDAKGEATFTFTPKREGTYVIRWASEDAAARDVITAETTVWVASASTRDIGYHISSDIDVLIDKDTMIVGDTANVLIATQASGRWVMVTTSAQGIIDTRVVHLDGTVKLVQIPLGEQHVPNFFVTATSVFDRRVATDKEQIVVPPTAHFIDVDVRTDREQYQPRDEGTITVTTRDANGKPVSAEVALAMSDEAVTAIQRDLAGDPRQFFFGETWPDTLLVTASATSQRYVRLVRDEQGRVIDENEKKLRDEREQLLEKEASFNDSAVVGGVAGGAAADRARRDGVPAPPAPPPPPMVAPQAITVTAASPAVAESITVANEPPPIAITVRNDFRSTALWEPNVITDASGTAKVPVQFPEALTTWRATARAATKGSQFGMGSSTAKTNMPLIVRLQAPRFFVVGDRATVSAVINNNTDAALSVAPSIEVSGLTLEKADAKAIEVAAHGETRVDWTVVAEKAGEAKLRVTGRGAKFGDAMEKTYTVFEHGIDKLIARSGKLRGSEAVVKLDLPRERRATALTVKVSPSLASTMLEALPYLIDYPYGCTEQTMSRFLPAAIVARTLEKLKLDRTSIAGKPLDAVTTQSIARLYDMQHDSGAWGWWKESGDDDFMTAYVVWGFALARDAGLRIDASRVDRAVRWLETRLPQLENDWNEEAWVLHAMSAWRAKPSSAERKAFDDAYAHRDKLTSYSRALLALASHRYGDAERTAVLVRNLENGAKIDRAPDTSVLLQGETTAETMATVHWGEDRFWWRWYDGPVETTAFVLQALVTIDPGNKLIEPAMNWLVKNRRGTRWDNTRDTAIALLALNDYLVASGELTSDAKWEVTVNGHPVTTSVDPSFLADAHQEIRIRRTAGKGPIYFAAEARFVSLEEPVKAAGNEVFVRREYFRLKPKPTLLKGITYDRLPLRDKESVGSGERVEVVVTIDAKNDYEYMLFEDLKPAGLEAVELQSGTPLYAENARGSVFVYQELRDRKVAMFIDRLPQGISTIRYTLRAETPGTFHALPLLGGAMYVPDVRANGDEVRITVEDAR